MADKLKLGMICHIEIPAPNLKKAKAFYSKLFGWDCSRAMGPTYCFWNDGHVGGALDADAKPSKAGTVLVIEVDDIDKKLVAIKKAGAKHSRPRPKSAAATATTPTFWTPTATRWACTAPSLLHKTRNPLAALAFQGRR